MIVKKNRSVGDDIARSGQIKNIHETGTSTVGGSRDGPVRLNAEVGTFYPESYRRLSFDRSSYKNVTSTKGLHRRPPLEALPKYAALNLTGSDYGAWTQYYARAEEPMHLAISPATLGTRATFTSGDSLREWVPGGSDHTRLAGANVYAQDEKGESKLPLDEEPWNTGPLATWQSGNFSQLLKYDSEGKISTKGSEYVETQIHGRFGVPEDVSHARANFAKLFGNPRFESLHAILMKAGKPIHWYYWDENVKEPNKLTVDTPGPLLTMAWKQASKIRAEDRKMLKAGLKEKPPQKASPEWVLTQHLESGLMLKVGQNALYELWQGLCRE
jgi:hypothetical protein